MRRLISNSIVVSLIATQALCLPPAWSQEGKAITGPYQHLYQTSGVLGDQDVFLSNNGLKIIDLTSGLTTCAHAPNWNVTVFDKTTRTTCTVSLDKFEGYLPKSEFESTGSKWYTLPFEQDGTITIAGINSITYTTTATFSDKQQKDFEREFADSKFIKNAQYCISKDIKASRQAISILCHFYGVPEKGGIPLQFKYHDLGGYLHVVLITTSRKSESKKTIDLDIPSDFTKVSSARQVLESSQAQKSKKMNRRPLL